MASLANDPRSFAELLRLRLASPGPRAVRLKALDGAPVWLRPATADLWLLDALQPPVHLPPAELAPEEIGAIWDLGANIGLTMCHMAVVCPRARIVGVELDAANAAHGRINLGPWSDRCELIEAAVWDSDGSVPYDRDSSHELGYHVVGDEQSDGARAPALSLNTLLERHTPAEVVDYVKMDIEGAESRVLTSNTEWAARVRSIKVEVHSPYTVEACVGDLERLGFRAGLDPSWGGQWMPPVLGIRPQP